MFAVTLSRLVLVTDGVVVSRGHRGIAASAAATIGSGAVRSGVESPVPSNAGSGVVRRNVSQDHRSVKRRYKAVGDGRGVSCVLSY